MFAILCDLLSWAQSHHTGLDQFHKLVEPFARAWIETWRWSLGKPDTAVALLRRNANRSSRRATPYAGRKIGLDQPSP